MKEQGKNAPDLTNEEEIGSLHEKEFIIMIVKMIQNLGNRMQKIKKRLGFPRGAVVESLPANAGDTGSSPGLGGSHMSRSN